jgi:hypothetical protein
MTKQTQEYKADLSMAMFDALWAIYAIDGMAIDAPITAVVLGYMMAFKNLVGEEGEEAPAKPKQRRARRKKSDMVALAAEVAND